MWHGLITDVLVFFSKQFSLAGGAHKDNCESNYIFTLTFEICAGQLVRMQSFVHERNRTYCKEVRKGLSLKSGNDCTVWPGKVACSASVAHNLASTRAARMFSSANAKFFAYRTSKEASLDSEDDERCPNMREQHRPSSPQPEDTKICGASVKAAPEPFDNSHIGFSPLTVEQCGLQDVPQPMEVWGKQF